jgi:hypothetical protein
LERGDLSAGCVDMLRFRETGSVVFVTGIGCDPFRALADLARWACAILRRDACDIIRTGGFAWARLNVKVLKSQFKIIATLAGFAYETSWQGNHCGTDQGHHDIPEGPDAALTRPTSEPASLGALALEAPGLSIWRRESVGAAQ